MEKSHEQLKHIERISRQTRHHRIHLNKVSDQSLSTELKHLANERERSILRSHSRRQLEEERKQLLTVTVKQIARERQDQPLPASITATEQETVQLLSKNNERRPSSAVKLPPARPSCCLFSLDCQLYPCQPVYQYTSFIRKEHDQTLRKRNSTLEDPNLPSTKPKLSELFTTIQEKKYQQNGRQLALAVQNQHHLANRHVSMQRTMTRLDIQSRLLHERLAEKKTFGYAKERQQKLTLAIQRHLEITAKFCS